jgi:cyclic beta-1,2-glucan synthetase
LSVTGYWEWVLGDLRQKKPAARANRSGPQDRRVAGAQLLQHRIPRSHRVPGRERSARTLTGDRKEFIGRNGSLSQPAALKRARLSGKVGAGLDPCGAVQVAFNLADGQERETSFRLGVGRNAADVQNLIRRFRRADASRVALEGVWPIGIEPSAR